MNNSIGILEINQATTKGPLSPFLTSFGMAGWTESACLAGKHQEPLFLTILAPHAGKPALRIVAFEILLDHILNRRTEIPVLLFLSRISRRSNHMMGRKWRKGIRI
jgi:hypothetical protein